MLIKNYKPLPNELTYRSVAPPRGGAPPRRRTKRGGER